MPEHYAIENKTSASSLWMPQETFIPLRPYTTSLFLLEAVGSGRETVTLSCYFRDRLTFLKWVEPVEFLRL